MAKKSKVVKELKRQRIVAKYADKRTELIEKGDYEALQKLPRDSSATRLHNRCAVSGRPRGYISKFGISESCFVNWPIKDKFPA